MRDRPAAAGASPDRAADAGIDVGADVDVGAGGRDPSRRVDADRLVLMAVVGGPHGVRGAVRLNVFAADPLALRRYNPFVAADGRSVKLRSVKPVGKAIVAEIDGVADRTAAEALNGLALSVPRSRLPRPDEDEFYHVDLIGLAAMLPDGTPLGTVAGIADYGAGDVVEIVGERTLVVPFTRAAVPAVDIAAGHVVVDPPPGLLDDDPDDAGDDPDAAPTPEPDGPA